MAVGPAGHDGADEVLEVPLVLYEVGGEPVEEFGVEGDFGLDAEVLGAFEKADAEEFLPESVDGDAGGEGVVGGDEPAGEVESAGWLVSLERRKKSGRVGGDFFAGLLVGADGEDVGFAALFLIGHDHDLGGGGFDFLDLFGEIFDFVSEFSVFGTGLEVGLGEEFALRFAALGRWNFQEGGEGIEAGFEGGVFGAGVGKAEAADAVGFVLGIVAKDDFELSTGGGNEGLGEVEDGGVVTVDEAAFEDGPSGAGVVI